MNLKNFSIIFINILIILSTLVNAQYSHVSFPIVSSELFKNLPNHESDYTMGVGDIDGDGETDIVIRVWDEGKFGDTKNYDFESWIYAYTLKGEKFWEFNTQTRWIRNVSWGFHDPCAMAPMTIWDVDSDGKSEVITTEGNDLVMLGYNNEKVEVEKRISLSGLSRYILSTIAFLQGRDNDPFIVIAYGLNSKVIAFDKNFKEYKRFDDPRYYHCYPYNVFIRGYDFDEDGNDELIWGSLLLDENLEIYIDGTRFGGNQFVGDGKRSFVADIDPDNPGYEWFLMRNKDDGPPSIPASWKGPYLIDIDTKRLLWHYDGSDNGYWRWGRTHRGWIGDVHEKDGIEIWMTGVMWKSKQEYEDSLKSWHNSGYKVRGGKLESWMLFDCKSKVLYKKIDQGQQPGYPLHWDDDTGMEWFGYRSGQLKDCFPNGKLIAQLLGHNGSGECTITDFLGDWREEIIVADMHVVHIYSNNEPTKFPDRIPLRKCRNYRIHQASIGSGLPKPYPPDKGWPVSLGGEKK